VKKIYLAIGENQVIFEHKFLKEVKYLYLFNHKNVLRYIKLYF